jgi:hypothetical protein
MTVAEALARGRAEERERIVEHLRQEAKRVHFVGGSIVVAWARDQADAIERLEHHLVSARETGR